MTPGDPAVLASRLLSGDRRTLSQLITLAESRLSSERQRVSAVLREARRQSSPKEALRVAFTGPPGVGKSSLIERLGADCIPSEQKLAVLALDPSSPTSGGSLLADRTRMATLSARENAFIRPSPQGGTLGGLGAATPVSIELCEWAGCDPVIIETVGVGQGEVDARDAVDCVVLVLGPDGGDELQGLKRGINETCDFMVVNKRDLEKERAERLGQEYRAAFAISRSGTAPELFLTSALDGSGVGELWAAISRFRTDHVLSGVGRARRAAQRGRLLRRSAARRFEQRLDAHSVSESVRSVEARLASGELSLDEATDVLLEALCREP